MSSNVKINGKWLLELPDSSAQEWRDNMKRHHNTWEMPRLLTLEKFIKSKPNPIVLYIGAYKGDMPALLASWGAKMILAESSPGFWSLIKETWELNNLEKPLGMFSGLMSKTTRSELTIKQLKDWPDRSEQFVEGHTGFTHLAESGEDATFPQITIDDLCSKLDVVPDLVTMDVEGSELPLMQKCVEMLKNHSATYMISIHPEFGYHNHGYYCRELFDLFGDNGYKWTYIDFDHEFHFYFEKKIDA